MLPSVDEVSKAGKNKDCESRVATKKAGTKATSTTRSRENCDAAGRVEACRDRSKACREHSKASPALANQKGGAAKSKPQKQLGSKAAGVGGGGGDL